MKNSIKNRKNILALCLSVMMFSSMAALAACKDDTSTDSSTSETSSSESTMVERDDGLIRNGTFETYDEAKALNTSVTGWGSVSVDGKTSKNKSGIIDLSAEGWKNLTGSYYENPDDAKSLTEEQAEAAWDNLTVKDKLNFYEAWKENNSGKTISSELDFYEDLGMDLDDIPAIEKFDTHDGAVANGGSDTHVLMIHNQYEEADDDNNTIGTAQKFTSTSSITVKAGTSAEFSVWVRTQDLFSQSTDGSAQEALNKGAYISITHAVGGKSLDAFRVENINTNGEWTQYSFILRGASYADTTFNLVLGLGRGTSTNRGEYVNGYAFFDDAKCTTISNEKFDELKVDADHTVTLAEEGYDKIFNADAGDLFALDFDFHSQFVANDDILSAPEINATTSKGGYPEKEYSSKAGDTNVAPWLNDGKGFDGANDVTKVLSKLSDVQTEAGTEDIRKYFAEDTNFADNQTLLMLSQNGVAYEAVSTSPIAIADGEYKAISVFVKTSAMNGFTGAGITLEDGYNNKYAFTSIDTTTGTPIEIDGVDIYNGWYQYIFFVENDSSATTNLTLTFNFGPTSIEESTKDSHRYGFAAFTNIQTAAMTMDSFETAQDGSYAKIVTITGETQADAEGNSFDSAMATPSEAIETGFANLQNYKGVYSDSAYVTGVVADSAQKEYYTSINTYAYAGLLNKDNFVGNTEKEITSYFNATDGSWMQAIANGNTDASAVWNSVFGEDSTQPLFIWNATGISTKSYGFVGKSTSVAANSYAVVSLRVKGTGANAYVRLVDTDAKETLSVGANRTYWYDDNGHICTGDPAEKNTMIAFRLQPNGLYKVDPSYEVLYNALKAKGQHNDYFANLSAYTDKNEQGDLLVAENGAKHDYNNSWNNEGVNGIAFYWNKDTNRYYAEQSYTTAVNNIADLSEELLKPRTSAADASNYVMEATITPVADKWTTVTFYIHTGDVAKNYRLELFSGNKAGEANAENTYVIFDYNNPGSADSNFTALLEEYEDKEGVSKLESVFSYYDSASFLRYNADLDENKIGNLYENNYTPSEQAEGIAFLRYEEDGIYTVFADYQYSEKTVAAEAVEEEEEEEEEDEDETDTNVWLLVSSLSVAAILVFAIASIVTRKLIVKARKKKAAQGSIAKPKKDKKSK